MVTSPAYAEAKLGIADLLRRTAGSLNLKNADERRTVHTRKGILESPAFTELWTRIKHRTTYRVNFDNAKLITNCAEAVREMPRIPEARVRSQVAKLELDRGGVRPGEGVREGAPERIEEQGVEIVAEADFVGDGLGEAWRA